VHLDIQAALQSGTIVIVAGTTNGYVAEEILARIGQSEGFSQKDSFAHHPAAGKPMTETGRLPDESEFPEMW